MNDKFVTYLQDLQLQLSAKIHREDQRINDIRDQPHGTEEIKLIAARIGWYKMQHAILSDIRRMYEHMHPDLNSDDMIKMLGKELAGDIQMEIDDNDIGSNTDTLDWFNDRNITQRLIEEVDHNRGR